MFLIGISNQLALVGVFLVIFSLPELVHGFFQRLLDLCVARRLFVLVVDDSIALLHHFELFLESPPDSVQMVQLFSCTKHRPGLHDLPQLVDAYGRLVRELDPVHVVFWQRIQLRILLDEHGLLLFG